jgi:hypothetical protein
MYSLIRNVPKPMESLGGVITKAGRSGTSRYLVQAPMANTKSVIQKSQNFMMRNSVANPL